LKTHLSTLLLAVASLGISSAAAESDRNDRPDITVHLYDYVAVSEQTLAHALGEAARILRIAGITTKWRVHALHDADAATSALPFKFGPSDLAVRVMPAEMAVPLGLTPDALGFAFPSQVEGIGTLALVVFDQIEDAARRPGLLMGHVIAHEIGHLLLGPNSHSATGIMQDPWTPMVLGEAHRGQLLFTTDQGSLMRERLNVRDGD
jgi:hypothetical protein